MFIVASRVRYLPGLVTAFSNINLRDSALTVVTDGLLRSPAIILML